MAVSENQEIQERVIMTREEVIGGKRGYWFLRRTQDIIMSLLGLILLCIPMLIIALLIYIDSPGAGPIYVQTRVGRDGKPFRFYKFRTMVPDADRKIDELLKYNEMQGGPTFKMANDPRITRFGRFLRKSSLDELPQLLNVLRGDMSIVGPRPPLPREVARYGPYEMQRLYVTPGLTCYWQVQPRRNELNFHDWMDLDVKYIRERSFWVDWKIIFMTFRAVFTLQGR